MYKVGFYGGKFLPFHRGHLNCILRAADPIMITMWTAYLINAFYRYKNWLSKS